MHCPRCNSENREQAQFCLNCGAKLVFACPECGTELPLSARFCDTCGAALGAPPPVAPEAAPDTIAQRLRRLVPKEYAERLLATRGQVRKERRTVTILFSDVKGSAAMADELDPEDWTEVMEGAFDVLIEPIYRYEGTLARLMGDAILAFFGAPIAHEDDPERACRAALEITAGAKRYAAKMEEERGIKGFDVRVGINTGLVVVGEIGSDLRVEYTAMGDAINLAARMESAAEPGTVLITEDTHKLVAPLFETEALGPMQVRGKAEPISVHRVLAAKAVPGKPRSIAGLESPLVGREAEFGALREALERLHAGVGGIVTLVGEAGIGKSRLVAEARVGAIHELPLQWVEGRCLSYGTSMAYLLWLDVLRGLLGVTVEDSPVTVRDRLWERAQELCPQDSEQVYPYLARLMSLPLDDEIEATMRDLEGEKLKANTFQAMEMLLQCAASERPLVLVCEDLHWADVASIDLLEQLLALTDRSSLLLICVFRPVKEHGSWGIKETAARRYGHRHTDIQLKPLSATESELLVGNLLQIDDLAPALKQRMLDVAEGNPFYVEEIIRSLVDQNAIFRDEASGRWVATEAAADVPIPDTLHGVLLARIDRLQEEAKRVLQMASVIGRIFLYRLLAAIAEEERTLHEHLLTLQREEMIRERARIPELEYIFKHELTREAAYNGLLKVERRVFHRQVAEALERLFPERIEEQLGLLAYHWERAGDAEKATAYLLRAGDQARLGYAHQEAIDCYQRALVFLKQQEDFQRAARTWMKLGLTHHTAFDFRRARHAMEEGFALRQRAGELEPAAPPPPAPHALRKSSLDFTTLDPAMSGDINSGVVIDHLFSGLVDVSPELDILPDVARSWEVLEGGRRYVFHLRDDVRWSDGTPVTADDFAYAWKRVLDPATGAPFAYYLYDVKGAAAFHGGQVSDPSHVGVRAVDELTLAVELEEPAAYLLQLLAFKVTYPLPRHVLEAHGEAWSHVENIVANGPFRLQAWRRGESMTLVRNPKYHGPFTGNLESVQLSFLDNSDPVAMLEAYETGGLDVLEITYFPPAEVERARRRHAGECVSVPGLGAAYVGFNTSRPPFDDVRVRRAFVLATDRERLADLFVPGFYAPASGGFVPQGMPGHSPGIALPHDPEQARRLLADARYPGGRGFPRVGLLAWTTPAPAMICEYLREQWRENLGVEITQEPEDLELLTDGAYRDRSQLFFWANYPPYADPHVFLGAESVCRETRWRNGAYDKLVEKATRMMDQEQRMGLYREADRILVEQAAIIPLAYVGRQLLMKPWVSRYPTCAVSRGFWKDVIIEAH
jgi:ABC-type oligopeptide transport system substrate-binding subunit/class 3 adenylate cyclase